MATVLAVIPESESDQSVDELSREFPGHDVVVVPSTRQVAAAVGSRGPDLVLFPLTLASQEQRALAAFLSRWDPGADGQGVSFSTPKALGSTTLDRRWFYWLKPAASPASSEPLDQSTGQRSGHSGGNVSETLSRKQARFAIDPSRFVERTRHVGASVAQSSSSTLNGGFAALSKVWRVIVSLVVALASLAAKLGVGTFRAAGASGSQSARWSWRALAYIGRLLARGAHGVIPLAVLSARRAYSAWLIAWPTIRRLAVWAASWVLRAMTGFWSVRSTALKVAAAVLVIASVVGLVGGASRILSRSTRPQAATHSETAASPEATANHEAVASRDASANQSAVAREASTSRKDATGRRASASGDVPRLADAPPAQPIPAEPIPKGRLSITSDPPRAAVLVDGERLGFTPMEIDDVTPGQHVVTLEQAAGSVRKVVKVKANETTNVGAAVLSGWLAVSAPFELQVWDEGRVLHVDGRRRVMVPAGQHELVFTNRTLGYRSSRVVTVLPGEVTGVSLASKTPITVTASVPSEVWIDGVHIGQTPLVDHPVDIGTREILCRNPASGDRRVTATVTTRPLRISIDFSKPGT